MQILLELELLSAYVVPSKRLGSVYLILWYLAMLYKDRRGYTLYKFRLKLIASSRPAVFITSTGLKRGDENVEFNSLTIGYNVRFWLIYQGLSGKQGDTKKNRYKMNNVLTYFRQAMFVHTDGDGWKVD